VQHYGVARSRYHFCHGSAIIRSFYIVGIDAAVSCVKGFSVAMEMQPWVPFALLYSYRAFRTAINNDKY
jgi:hypothetical protein